MKTAIEHLRKDAKLSILLDEVPIRIPPRHDDVYFILLRSIVEQQLSLKAAATIWKRFQDRIGDYPDPQRILAMPVEEMRACGLSYQKAGYLQNIARFAQEEDLSMTFIESLDNDAAIQHLSRIKGVGKWTAEMILMFSLGRADVFPVDDLVIRNAMVKLYGVTSEKRQLIKDLEAIAEHWRPYRSYACYALWDWKDKK